MAGNLQILVNFKKRLKATINPVNDDNKFFQYAGTVALNQQKIGTHIWGISKIRTYK